MISIYETEIWERLAPVINNDYGTAALMGNLQAESGLIPYRLQGDFTTGYVNSLRYTENVNNYSYTKNQFINDSQGYGLAQWTYFTRKQNLYEFLPISSYSIGSLDRQIPFLINELQTGYPTVWNALRNATNIRTPSNAVLHDFENPSDQSEAVEIARAQNGTDIYNRQHGTPPPPVPPPVPPSPSYTGIPVWMMWKLTNDFR